MKSVHLSESEGSYEYEDELDDDDMDPNSRFKTKRKERKSNIVYNRCPKLVAVDENSRIAGGTTDRINQDGFSNPFTQMISLKQLQ